MGLYEEVELVCKKAKKASHELSYLSVEARNDLLRLISAKLIEKEEYILDANKADLKNAKENGMTDAMLDRLSLSHERIASIADSILKIAGLEDPLGNGVVFTRPNGLKIEKVKVPLGLVGIIYEARPNVTSDAAALCLKSGNAVVLRGGKEAIISNTAIVSVIRECLKESGIDENAVSIIENTSRESANALMKMKGIVDVLIPRGGKNLINSVVENSKVPVIETGAGNCHIFVDESAKLDMALSVTINAKCSRPSVCNAVETLLVHEKVAKEFLPKLYEKTRYCNLEFRGCEKTLKILKDAKKATEEDYATEYDDYILSVKIVGSVDEAIEHINKYTTGHSEAIITENPSNAEKFVKSIDSCALYVNASTRFTDGGEFGFGAEIGISTQKLHVRGPMGLDALTTEKYIIKGDGQIR